MRRGVRAVCRRGERGRGMRGEGMCGVVSSNEKAVWCVCVAHHPESANTASVNSEMTRTYKYGRR